MNLVGVNLPKNFCNYKWFNFRRVSDGGELIAKLMFQKELIEE